MECKPHCVGMKMLVIGLVIILARMYTTWDIWVVIGVIVVLKGLMCMMMPKCKCNDTKVNKKK